MVVSSRIRAFTPTEVLVVVLLCLFLLLILPPVVHMQGGGAFRMTCGTNLSSIGKAMLIYANDYEDQLPRAGGRNSLWTGRTPDWQAPTRHTAYGLAADGTGGEASISASLYLLVKYCEVTPRTFLCRGGDKGRLEEGMSEFRPGKYALRDKKLTLIDFWDFGPHPFVHCSYAYQVPNGPYALTTEGDPAMAVAADRNPWMDAPSAKAKDFAKFRPDIPPFGGTSDEARHGNTIRHNVDGQSVLFLDSRVEFSKRSFCGLDDDNIYTISGRQESGDPLGTPPKVGSQPANRRDSLLVNDPPAPKTRKVSP